MIKIVKKHIAFFIPTLNGGGAERVAINLLKEMLKHDVSLDLVLASAKGPYLEQVPKEVRIVNLEAGRVLKSILPLSRYLQKSKPYVLLSHMNDANVIAVLATKLARTKTRLALVEHNTLSTSKTTSIIGKCVPLLMKMLYPQADTIIGVSKGVSSDLELQLGLPLGSVTTIYNPVVNDDLIAKAKAPFNHPWFQTDTPPVFLAVGRLSVQKDFQTLIKAFAILRKQTLARLLILGEGTLRGDLESMICSLDIADDISMPGFVENPYPYMHRASAFVLSSCWEGLPTVLIEAMACGCPVISTDCPNGPKEILDSGKYGSLVPVGDPIALSQAMLQTLNTPVNQNTLVERSMYFYADRAVSEYLALLEY